MSQLPPIPGLPGWPRQTPAAVPPPADLPASPAAAMPSGPPVPGTPWFVLAVSGFAPAPPPPSPPTPPVAAKEIPLVPRVPLPLKDERRLARFTEVVSNILNSLIAQGLIEQTGPASWAIPAVGVVSFDGRKGVVTLTAADVSGALGYTPANAAASVRSFNTRFGDVSLTSSDVTGALGDANIAYTDVANTFTGGPQIISTSTVAAGGWRINHADSTVSFLPFSDDRFYFRQQAQFDAGFFSNASCLLGTTLPLTGDLTNVPVHLGAFSTAATSRPLVLCASSGQTAPVQQLLGISSTSTVRIQADIDAAWNAIDGTAGTDATRSADLIFRVWSVTTAQEGFRISAAAAGCRVGFFAATPVAQQASGADLTNNVVASGTTDQIDDFTSLTVYATDAAAIHNDIYQLARKVKQINDALRKYGLLT